MTNDELDRKLTRVFAGKVVRKDLVRKVKVGANVPVFVLEYLLGKYCATDDAAAIEAGLRVVNTTISSNFVRPDEANKAQSMVKDKGKHTLIDKVKVRYLSDDDKYWAELLNFGHKFVHVPEHFLREYDRLLMGGIWAQIDIRPQYDEDARGKRSPFWIDSLKPIQIASFDLAEYQNCRREFSADEWLDLLLRTIGLEPQSFDRRLKMMFLVRMIPLCEHNFNLVELGPRGTGKSYAYQELSLTLFPLGNADCCRIDLECGKKILFDFADTRDPEDENDLRCDLTKELREDLEACNRDYFDVVAFNHLDKDHFSGATEFFYLEQAKKYQGDDRIKMNVMWVPAALITEQGPDDDEARILQKEARHRFREGKGIRVFSRPERLRQWCEENGIKLDDRVRMITDAGELYDGPQCQDTIFKFLSDTGFLLSGFIGSGS